MASSPACTAAVLAELTRIGRESKLASFEIPKAVHLDHVVWSVDNGLLTAAFKSKRPALTKHYATVIEKYVVLFRVHSGCSLCAHVLVGCTRRSTPLPPPPVPAPHPNRKSERVPSCRYIETILCCAS